MDTVQNYDHAENLNLITSLEAERYRLLEQKATTDKSLMINAKNLKRMRKEAETFAIARGLESVEDDAPMPKTKLYVAMAIVALTLAGLAYALYSASASYPEIPDNSSIISISSPVSVMTETAVKAVIEPTWDNQKALAAYTSYVATKNPALVACGFEMVKHTRWVEALAISGIETTFATRGNAVNGNNNPGNLKSRMADRVWRRYETLCDGLEDIAYLIERDDYSGLTLDEMNGRYCVDETQPGNRCVGWSETATQFAYEIMGD